MIARRALLPLLLAAPALAQPVEPIEKLVDADYRTHDVIQLKGQAEPIVGTIQSGREETAAEITIKKAKEGLTFGEKRTQVEWILDRQTPESALKERAARLAALKPPQGPLHRRLAEWGFKHGLLPQAEEQLEAAVAAEPDPAKAAEHRERVVGLLEARAEVLDGGARDDLLERIARHAESAARAGVESPRLRLASARVSVRLGLSEAAIAELEQAQATLATRAAGPPVPEEAEPPAETTPPGGGAQAPGGGGQRPPGGGFRRDGEGLPPQKGAPGGGGGAPPPPRPKGKPATDLSAEKLAGLPRAERPLVAQVNDLLGELELQRGKLEPALAAFKRVLEVWPEEARASLGLARALAAQGEREAALTQLATALGVSPGDPELLLVRGQLFYLQGQDAEALTDLQAGLAQVPDRESPLARDLLVAAGLVHLVAGRPAEAAPLLEQADAQPGWGPARLARGLLAEQEKDLDKARTHYDEAARLLSPHGGEASYMMAWALLGAGKSDEAAARLRQALAAGHEFQLTVRALVAVARKKGDAAEEGRLLELLVRAQPEPEPDLLADLGRSYLGSERVDEAQVLFERGLKQAPEHLGCLRGLAACAYKGGQREKARELFQQLLAKDEKDAWAQQGLRNIEEARTRRVWIDPFGQAEVENSWKATTDFGVLLRPADGKLKLSGTQANALEEGITRLTRTVEGEVVVKFEVVLEVSSPTTRCGIRWERDRGSGLVVFRDFDGRIKVSSQDDPKRGWSDPQDLGPWPAEGAHALAIDVVDPQKQDVAVLLDGKRLHVQRVNGFGTRTPIPVLLAIYARGQAMGSRVEAAADEARVFVLRPEPPKQERKQ